MKSLRLEATGNLEGLRFLDLPEPVPRKSEAIVQIHAASINHRDLFICEGRYAKIELPVILGADGSGIVESVGDSKDAEWVGKFVVINPGIQWGDDPRVQSKNYRILGMPDDGTFAEKVRVPVANLYVKPDHLSFEDAAAIPLAGVTAYRALMVQGQLRPDQTVLITGIGGGVASLGLKMAVAAGARVWVTSSSEEKISAACELGAEGGCRYDRPEWDRQVGQLPAIDLVLDGTGGNGIHSLLNIVRPGGRIVIYGATTGVAENFDLRRVFWKQLTVQGSTMGSPDDFSAMISFVNQKKIHPIIDNVMQIENARRAFDRMKKSQQFGKLILKP